MNHHLLNFAVLNLLTGITDLSTIPEAQSVVKRLHDTINLLKRVDGDYADVISELEYFKSEAVEFSPIFPTISTATRMKRNHRQPMRPILQSS